MQTKITFGIALATVHASMAMGTSTHLCVASMLLMTLLPFSSDEIDRCGMVDLGVEVAYVVVVEQLFVRHATYVIVATATG